MTHNPQHKLDHAPQHRRWIKYGLNVAVLVLAVVAIVVFVNYIAYRRYIRFDLTQTRQHTLSAQTLTVLSDLKNPVQITTFYDSRSIAPELRQQVDDLIAEYRRRSGRITVQQIDPAIDIDKREAFIKNLLERYGSDARKNHDALTAAKSVLDAVRAFAQTQPDRLSDVLTKVQAGDEQIVLLLRQLNQVFQILAPDLRVTADDLEAALGQSLPDYADARSRLTASFENLANDILKPAVDRMTRVIDTPSTPAALKDALLGLRSEYQQLQARLDHTIASLRELQSGPYEEIRAKLQQSNSIVVTTDEPAKPADSPQNSAAPSNRGIVVLTLEDVYPNFILAGLAPNQIRPEQGYKGEEALTGAILKLTVHHDTKIVFLNPYPQPMLMPRAMNPQGGGLTFSVVADRLRAMNFDVSEWQPGGTMTPFGPQPPQPRPVAKPGQKMVFVALPAPPFNPQRPVAPTGPAIAEALSEHLTAGQPAVVFTAPSPTASMLGQADPVQDIIAQWGITIDSARVIYNPTPTRDGRTAALNQLRLTDWPTVHPVSQAVKGLTGLSFQGQPMTLSAKPPEGVTLWPLAQTPASTWADTEFNAQQAQQDSSDPAGPFTVVAAAQKSDQRLVVFSDVAWASDVVAEAGEQAMINFEPVTIYRYFPANPELFVNSICWLAGLDQLIAPSPRSQDVRRIEAVSPGVMIALWWTVLGGLPLATLAAGGAVWMMRRR